MKDRILKFAHSSLGKTDKFFSLIDSAIISLCRLGAGMSLARLAGAEGFAQYMLLMMAGIIFINLPVTFFISPMVNLASGRNPEEKNAILLWTHSRLKTVWYLGLVLVLIGLPIALSFGFSLGLYLGFVCATLVGFQLMYHRSCLQAGFNMKHALKADALGVVVLVLFVLIGHLLNDVLLGFWWGSAIASTLSLLLMKKQTGLWENESGKVATSLPADEIRMMAQSSGKAMLLGAVANSVCSRIQPFILGSVGGLLVVAQFGVAWTLIGPLRMFSAGLSSILRPRLAMHMNLNRKVQFKKSLNLGIFLALSGGVCCLAVVAIWGQPLVGVLFNSILVGSNMILILAMLYGTLDVITTLQMVALQTADKQGAGIASKLRVVSAVISITLIFPACMTFGEIGAFASLLVAESVYAIGARIYLARMLKVNPVKDSDLSYDDREGFSISA